jgi:hypothetical protein
MRSDNLEDFNFKDFQHHLSESEIKYLMSYNMNDVTTTMQLYERTLDVIKVREMYSEKYNIDLYSASEAKMARELLLHMISERMGCDKSVLRELRTPRGEIIAKDLIFDYVRLKSDTGLNDVYKAFNDLVISGTKGT